VKRQFKGRGTKAIAALRTEAHNAASAELDTKSALAIARIINQEDHNVPQAVERALPQIARAIDAAAEALAHGGRLIYVGAGTSGRLAALDAAECPPTFGAAGKRVQCVIAGGERVLARSAEFNEDSRRSGERDIARRRPTSKDVVVGITASGRTPYTVAAVAYAKRRGARTVAVACNPRSELGRIADIEIVTEVGPEVVSGSTRMKAGTAQKLVLNMISTGAFARLGYVYGNLMVHLSASNQKLVDRRIRIVAGAAGVSRSRAAKALRAANNQITMAVVMLKTGSSPQEARRRLQRAQGNVRKALQPELSL
jgi:N-acetylmuramic acid 6-phosphate etherase